MTQNIQNSSESHASRTSKAIAFTLIGIYGVALITIGIVAAFKSSPQDQAWIELFKSGFLILGGGLTTVLGYYFGARGIQEAQASADEAKKAKEEATAKLKELQASSTPTFDEVSLTGPEEMPGSEKQDDSKNQ